MLVCAWVPEDDPLRNNHGHLCNLANSLATGADNSAFRLRRLVTPKRLEEQVTLLIASGVVVGYSGFCSGSRDAQGVDLHE